MKAKTTKHKSQNINHQQGVTLLLAILILASILAISFSVATILLIEVKSSGDLLRTEGAFYGADGVGEQALFNLKRSACPSNTSSCYTTGFNNSVAMQASPSLVTSANPIFTDKVTPGTSISNTPNKYDFCNVTAGSNGCNFGKVTVNYITTNQSTDPLNVYLCEWDPNAAIGTYPNPPPCSTVNTSGRNQNYWLPPITGASSCGATQQVDGSVQLTPSTVNCVSWNVNPNFQQELIMTNGGTSNIYFSVATFATGGTQPQGLPYVGKTAIAVGTSNGDVGRKIQVIAPNASIALGNTVNYAAAANGATVVASTVYGAGFPASSVIDGDRTGANWGAGGGWNDATSGAWPDWLEVDFAGTKSISEIDVYNIQDNYASPSTPTAGMTFSVYGLTSFEVQYNSSGTWVDVPGGNISGNSLVWNKLTFPSVTTDKIRVLVHDSASHDYSRLIEVEAY